jgi:hypothetical protein
VICPVELANDLSASRGVDAEGKNSEQRISSAEMERMMKVQEVILKVMAGSLKVAGGGRNYWGI